MSNENVFKTDAKSIVDMLFDTKCFREDITRDSMNNLEEFIQFCMKSRHDSHILCTDLMNKINNKKD